jgi:glycosyltransferase involved in cell wall biosynthesis
VRLRTEHLPPIYISPYTRYLVKPLDWMTNLILTVSDANLDDQLKLLDRNPHKLFRSYPGIELDRFDLGYDIKDAKRNIGLDPELPIVGLVGRLVEQKGHTYLINSIPRIIKEFGPVNFLFIGEGLLENQLRKQVSDLEMGRYVHFKGYQSNPYQFMKAMDIGVMPSLQEGLPIALLEFMAFGKPVLASSLPCFKEAIVDGESGLIVSLDEENSLADNTLMLLRNPAMAVRMGQAALKRVQSHFNIQRLANHMMDLYDSLLENNQNN